MRCAVDGCHRPRRENGIGGTDTYCAAHRSRVTRTGDVQAHKPIRPADPGCLVAECARKHKAFGYCVTHYRRWKKTGDPFGMLDRPRADESGYAAAHWRLRRDRGSAATHTCRCGQQASEWAYTHDDPDERRSPEGLAFSLKAEHYEPMCVSCHRSLDANHRKVK